MFRFITIARPRFFSTITVRRLPLFVQAVQHQQNTAVLSEGQRFTYSDILRDVDKVKGVLHNLLGASSQQKPIAFLFQPSYQYVAVQWGIWNYNGICVPLHPGHPPAELSHILHDSQAVAVIVDRNLESHLAPLNLSIPIIKWPFDQAATSAKSTAKSSSSASSTSASAKSSSSASSTASSPSSFSSSSSSPSSSAATITAPAAAITTDPTACNTHERALIIYTSGTTGKPKGVVSSHAVLEAQIRSLVEAWKYTAQDHILHVLPLHHVHGVVNALLCVHWAGGAVSFLPKFDAQHVWQRFQEGTTVDGQHYPLNLFMAVPTIYSKLISFYRNASPAQQAVLRAACTHFRLMVSGSMALPEPTMTEWRAITGHMLLERYGMTEIGMALSNPLEPASARKPGYVGRPLPGVRVRIDGVPNEAPETGAKSDSNAEGDVAGELLVKGPTVFVEYWNNPQATKGTFDSDGWFKTGDVAQANRDGEYRILGRASVDVLKTAGYKVSALEIETTLLSYPGVDEVAVVGIPSTEYGQIVGCILAVQSQFDQAAFQQWCRTTLAPYKVPRKVLIVPHIPRNAMGKVNKKELVRLFA